MISADAPSARRTLIDPGKSGLLCTPGDADTFADAAYHETIAAFAERTARVPRTA